MRSPCNSLAILTTLFTALVYANDDLKTSYELWNEVVSHHISPGHLEGISVNVVDYESIRSDENFYKYLTVIRDVDTKNFTHSELYAFFMNVYNAFAIKMILEYSCHDCHPIESIKDIGSTTKPVWKMTAGYAGGRTWSLDDVEDYLRNPTPFKEDSRLHSCIVCASISCPNVRMTAFEHSKVDQQMTRQMQEFLNNTKKGLAVDESNKVIHLSSIFNWFKADFEAESGSVRNFIMPYVPPQAITYLNNTNFNFEYFDYNWNLNGMVKCNCTM
ncbi:uncharacterized protein [Dysidea avara]|uniref:uncharacterized protein n=1 Tax=Dysidea avara TaxID=196820 RepID=UPI00331EAABD